jgi:hypothetical protein
MIGEPLTHVARKTRSPSIPILSQYCHVGPSIEAITIKCKHCLNIAVANPLSAARAFPDDFLEKTTFCGSISLTTSLPF